jgi:hypothetical protein
MMKMMTEHAANPTWEDINDQAKAAQPATEPQDTN